MKLVDILKPEYVEADLKSKTRVEVLGELVGILGDKSPVPARKLVQVLNEREEQSPTAMNGGVAVPHGRLPDLEMFVMAVGRSPAGVDFGAEDGPTKIFFLLLAPVDDTANHLKILARVARLCRNSPLRERIIKAGDAREIWEAIAEEDAGI